MLIEFRSVASALASGIAVEFRCLGDERHRLGADKSG